MVVPTDWSPTAGQYWQLNYIVDANSTAADTFTVQIGYDGTPVHLLP